MKERRSTHEEGNWDSGVFIDVFCVNSIHAKGYTRTAAVRQIAELTPYNSAADAALQLLSAD
jgi:hypothetical protein